MASRLLTWSGAMVAMYQAGRTAADEHAAAHAAAEFAAYLKGHAARRRDSPADDLITHLLAAEAEGEHLSPEELVSTCILLLNAGHEATVHSIGNGAKALLESGHRQGGQATTEEILRHDPPLHLFTRHVYETTEVAGHRLAAGSKIGCLLAAANRDPAVWDRPDQFDPDRPLQAHVAFGAGIHFCVGAPLARLELGIALDTLFARCPDLTLAEPPRYADLYHFHGLERLIVRR